jgi:hypothetical protein
MKHYKEDQLSPTQIDDGDFFWRRTFPHAKMKIDVSPSFTPQQFFIHLLLPPPPPP